MGTNSAIEWCNHSWNPWQGCNPVSDGCLNCYMFDGKKRWGQDPTAVVRSKTTFNAPLHPSWKAGSRVFVCSWSDFCHEQADPWRIDAWDVMRQRPDITYLILTKRQERLVECLPGDWGDGWPNVWLGITAENQAMLEKRVPALLRIPAAVRFVSCEPLLGPITFRWAMWHEMRGANHLDGLRDIDWVIAGCESGGNRRAAKIEWFQSLRTECEETGIPFFLKQMEGIGHLIKMPVLDGRVWGQVPKTQTQQKET